MSDLRSYVCVTAAYWAFTLTDGALRMLVLLHFHLLGYAPLDLAVLFLLYEAMGVVTNVLGGWLGARHGLRVTLFAGLAVQVFALIMLSLVDPGWEAALSVAYVMAAQALSGIAKDLTKMSSKSAVKLAVRGDEPGLLFRWVALLTGSKNALKGIGFLLGGVLLAGLGFQVALWSMAGALAAVLAGSVLLLTADLGRAKRRIGRRDLFSKSREINWLSAARIFLFAARDVWFVVGVPLYLYDALGWSFSQVGGFMALWVIGYGIVQAAVPRALGHIATVNAGAGAAKLWGAMLAVIPAAIAVGITPGLLAPLGVVVPPDLGPVVLIGGLLLFGVVFAVNSSLHSWLIVAYSDDDKVALNVGFYYAANAVGRFAGTLLSGLLFQLAGLGATLWASALMVAVAVLCTLPLTGARGRSSRTGMSLRDGAE